MYLTEETLREIEARYGAPRRETAAAEFTSSSFGLVDRCRRKGRLHDVTLMIWEPERRAYALIRKPSYPPGVFRPPSGGVEDGEPFEEGARREAREETGLEVRLERYLLRVDARFTCSGDSCPWTTHVFSAVAVGGVLDPLDRHEIEEACWGTPEEIWTRYRSAMLAMNSAGMRYRVFLQDTALELLGHVAPGSERG